MTLQRIATLLPPWAWIVAYLAAGFLNCFAAAALQGKEPDDLGDPALRIFLWPIDLGLRVLKATFVALFRGLAALVMLPHELGLRFRTAVVSRHTRKPSYPDLD